MSADRSKGEARHPVLATVLMGILRAIDRDSSGGYSCDEGSCVHQGTNEGSRNDPLEMHRNASKSQVYLTTLNHTSYPPPPHHPHSNVQGGRICIPIFSGKEVFSVVCLGKIFPRKTPKRGRLKKKIPEIWGVFFRSFPFPMNYYEKAV